MACVPWERSHMWTLWASEGSMAKDKGQVGLAVREREVEEIEWGHCDPLCDPSNLQGK